MAKKIFNIVDFGAVPNKEELQTEKIQAAIDECFRQGGGEVVVPEGVFLTGSVRIRSNITLHLLKNAVIKGSRNPDDYFGYVNDELEPLGELVTKSEWIRAENSSASDRDKDYEFMRLPGSRWNNGLIRAVNAENISIIGEEGAMFDGSDCFDEKGEEYYRGPHCISCFYCKNISFKNYTVKDSANWAHSTFYCENVEMDNVSVHAGHDGIHMTVSKNIVVRNCTFHTGDDCLGGFANLNVYVHNCVLNSACSALRLGGTNMLVEKCRIYAPCKYLFRGCLTPEEKRSGAKPSLEGRRTNMLSVFTYFSDYSVDIDYQPGNIIIKDCEVDYADRFIHFNFSGNEMWQSNRPLESIRFENIKATNIAMPLTAYGSSETPVTVEFKNVEISMREGSENIDFMKVANFKRISLKDVKIDNYKGSTLIKSWTEGGEIEIENLECDVKEENYFKLADEEFVCQTV